MEEGQSSGELDDCGCSDPEEKENKKDGNKRTELISRLIKNMFVL